MFLFFRVPLAVANNLMQVNIHRPGRFRATEYCGFENVTSTNTAVPPFVLRQMKGPTNVLPSSVMRLGNSTDQRRELGHTDPTVVNGSSEENGSGLVKEICNSPAVTSNDKERSGVTVVTIAGADFNVATKSVAQGANSRETGIDILTHL